MKAITLVHTYLRNKAVFYSHKPLRVDRRTKVGKLALKMVAEIEKDYNFTEVKEKVKQRRENKREITNVLNTPIVKDYFNNKHCIKQIREDRLVFFNGRNHWAKTEQDYKILKTLRRWQQEQL